MMQADLGAQIAVSLLAHIGLFFTANTFLSTADVPNFELSINATYVSSTRIGVVWNIHSLDGTEVSSIQLSIFSDQNSALTQSSPVLRNITRGNYKFQHLQPDTVYNACVITFTRKKNIHLSKCVSVITANTGFSRLKILASLPSGNTDLTIFLCLLVIGIFIAIVVSSYNMYMQTIRAKRQSEYRSNTKGLFDQAYEENDAVTNEQLKEPLLIDDNEVA